MLKHKIVDFIIQCVVVLLAHFTVQLMGCLQVHGRSGSGNQRDETELECQGTDCRRVVPHCCETSSPLKFEFKLTLLFVSLMRNYRWQQLAVAFSPPASTYEVTSRGLDNGNMDKK